ncbi:MAG TPA: DNA-3-methyladenine glycosylase [Acidimicrobiales bacterium]|nr:DNA-3-methyladenine glycosylase [Acidimicrobiales bacterium]
MADRNGWAPLGRDFYVGDSRAVAPLLLNKLLVKGDVAGRIVEVEAYRGAEDPASHAYRGPTRRNATMFGPPGHLYVYFSYGVHWCANAVCGPEGTGHAVLLRALAPVAGVEQMWPRRLGARRAQDLCSGPGKLCQALDVGRDDDGADLVSGGGGVRIVTDGAAPPGRPGRGPRVGISVATDQPWRWWVTGDPNVSRGGRPRRVAAEQTP